MHRTHKCVFNWNFFLIACYHCMYLQLQTAMLADDAVCPSLFILPDGMHKISKLHWHASIDGPSAPMWHVCNDTTIQGFSWIPRKMSSILFIVDSIWLGTPENCIVGYLISCLVYKCFWMCQLNKCKLLLEKDSAYEGQGIPFYLC